MAAAWALFRLEVRRTWTWRRLALAAAFLGLVVTVQGVVTWASIRIAFSPDGWAYSIPLYAGLISGYWHPHFYPPTTMTTAWDIARYWCAIPEAAIRFVMPAFAAAAFAADREKGRLSDLALAPITPRALFLAKGAAAALPFLALAAAGSALLARGYLHAQALDYLPTAAPSLTRATLLDLLLGTPCVAGILLCISARCRHIRQAMLACYVVSILLLPLLDVELVWAIANPNGRQLHAPHP
jgi:hypothetical protein